MTRRLIGVGWPARVVAVVALTMALALVAAVGGSVPAWTSSADAAVRTAAAAPFTAGMLISDQRFFDDSTMSASDVQRFLERRKCTPKGGAPCLDDFRASVPALPASPGRCDAISAHSDERASAIIVRVAQACAINPQVLLVLLQKEQSLLTAPSVAGYRKATGYACPDTADCEARYAGFVNQVYRAARQFREYTAHPDEWRYRIGVVKIGYSPVTGCGSSSVRIRNQATANLYNYTPYQPNARTIAHPDAPNPCSAYGNLNFVKIFTSWFGSPQRTLFRGLVPACLNLTGGYGCPPPVDFPAGSLASRDARPRR